MSETGRHKRTCSGFTLVECMVMLLILMIVLSGTLGFRYFSVLSAERAEDQILAARAAHVISEAWRGQKGDGDFDPSRQGFDDAFQVKPVALSKDIMMAGASFVGAYQIEIEERTFRANLTYEDAPTVPNARILHVVLTWQDTARKRQQFKLSTLSRTAS